MRKLLLLLTAITLMFLFYSCPTGLLDNPEDDDTTDEETVSRNDVTILSCTYSDETAVIFYTEPSDSDFYATELTFTPSVSGITQPVEIKKGESLLSGTTSLGYLADLSNDTEYTITLTAVYSDDSSAAGVSAKVTPRADVYPPENLTAVRGDGEVTLSWDDPDDNNWYYINFEFTPEDGGYVQPFAIFSSETEYTIDGLTNGTEYTFNVYASDFFDLESSKVEITATPSADLNPPSLTAASVFLIDVDMDEGKLAGICEIEMAADESDIERYKLYWGSSETVKLDETAITSIDKTGADLEYTFSEDTAVPSGAAYLLVYTENGDGENDSPLAYELKDFILTEEPYTGAMGGMFVEYNSDIYTGFEDVSALFKWNGTTFEELSTPELSLSNNPSDLTVMDDRILFRDNFTNDMYEFFPDTLTVSEIETNDCYCQTGIVYDGKYYFEYYEDNLYGRSLFCYDGSNPIYLVYDCDSVSTSQFTSVIGTYDNKLMFSGTGSDGVVQLYSFDGIDIVQLSNFTDTGAISENKYFITDGDFIFFHGPDGDNYDFYSWDGNTVSQLTHFAASGVSVADSWGSIYWDNTYYFPGVHETSGVELYSFDGSNELLEYDFYPDGEGLMGYGGYPLGLIEFDDYIFMQAYNDGKGLMIYLYDGVHDPTPVVDVEDDDNTSAMTYTTPYYIIDDDLIINNIDTSYNYSYYRLTIQQF